MRRPKLRVLSRKSPANSTVVRLRLDGVDGGPKLAGERHGLVAMCGETPGTDAVDSSTPTQPTRVHEWSVLTACLGGRGADEARTIARAFQPVGSSGAAAGWETTQAGAT